MSILQAKFEVPTGMKPLDDFNTFNATFPQNSFVITRDAVGYPLSYFGDLVWDFTAYTHDGRAVRRSFIYWDSGEVNPEKLARIASAKELLFAIVWRKTGFSLSLGTVNNYITVALAMCAHTEGENVSLAEFLANEKLLTQFAIKHCSGWMAETLGSMLAHLGKLKASDLGFPMVGIRVISAIKKISKRYRSSIKQHPPMPTAIYCKFVIGLKDSLSDWLGISNEMLMLLTQCASDPRMGRTIEQQLVISSKLNLTRDILPTFDSLAPAECIKYLEQKGKKPHVKSLSYVATEAQVICKLIIQTFTGMRDDEAASLPYDCIENVEIDGRSHYFIKGYTTKSSGGVAKRTRWVTNIDGYKAIIAARSIADAIYGAYKISPDCLKNSVSFPLFVSVGYCNFASSVQKPKLGRFLVGGMTFAQDSTLRNRLQAVINNEDLLELEHIDPHRAWRTERKFFIGERWTFSTHQLRRSLALYAQRSGLVSLPSLRRQLQHLTEAMSQYYTRGSSYAKDFLDGNKEHFANEWQATQAESAGLSYILNALTNDDRLIGGHANWLEHRLKRPDGTIVFDRATTMKRFKRGEMAYRETLLGGCVNVDVCDRNAVNWIDIDCLRDNCKNLVCSVRKLEKVTVAQRRMVEGIDPNSVEYRTETADLAVLEEALTSAKNCQKYE